MTRALPHSNLLLFWAFAMSAITSAQYFAPFTANSRKLLGTLDHYTTFGIAFDSAR